MGVPAAVSDMPLDDESSRIVEAFEEVWESARPDVAEFLHRHPHRPLRLLLELAAIDLERRLRRREAAAPEEYRDRFPELGLHPGCAAELDRVARTFHHHGGGDGRPGVAEPAVDDASMSPIADVESLLGRLAPGGGMTGAHGARLRAGTGSDLHLGPYLLLDVLGSGGMGAVYRAEHRTMRREVALKVIKREGLESPEAVRRFEREVHAAARLQHPNIVTAYDAGEAAGTHYLVMELIDGRSLAEVIRDDGPQPPPRAIDWVLQAARGLAYAHGRGVVHRDIKPGNLLLDRDGTVKILDMGLARLEQPDQRHDQLTNTGQVMGTVDFMAPEQALDTRLADARADIYSLGVTLWYLLAGRPLFEADSAVRKLLAHQQRPAPNLADAGAAIDPRLDAVFQRMVAKKPEDRFQSMGEVIAALDALPGGEAEPGPARTRPGDGPAAPDPSGTPATEGRRRTTATPHEPAAASGGGSVDARAGSGTIGGAVERRSSGARPLHPAIGGFGVAAVLIVGAVVGAVVLPVGGLRGDRRGASWRPAPARSAAGLDAVASLPAAGPPAASRPEPPPGSPAAPPLAVAPFGAAQARAHQEAWAKHLGIPVETTNSIGQKLVLIPPSCFTMGAGDNTMQVALTAPYRLAATEVTQEQWTRIMGTKPWKMNQLPDGRQYWTEGERVAATTMSWTEAVAFCERLTARERSLGLLRPDQEYRLPTEAEWENACRAGTTTLFSFGDDAELLDAHGWFGGGWDANLWRPTPGGNTLEAMHAHEVGVKAANNWGLHDMHGNVQEWCHDLLPRRFPPRSVSNPLGVPREPQRATRGGGWYSNFCVSHARLPYPVDKAAMGTGFRVALAATDPDGASFEPVRDAADSGRPATSPTPAVAPSDAARARPHREIWAKHLAMPVETTNSIGQTLVLIPPGRFTTAGDDDTVDAMRVREVGRDPRGAARRVPAAVVGQGRRRRNRDRLRF